MLPMAGPGGTAADKNGKFSHLHRFLTALKHSDERRDGDSQTLASYIEAERRDLDAEAFSLLDRELQSRIGLLAKSNDPLDKKTALLAIDELIRAKATVDNSARVVALTRCIKTVMNSCNDNRILKQAAQVMGSLVRNGGNMTAEVVNREVLEALDQLRRYAHNTSEQRRLAACHMLKELADSCPAVFNVHVRQFVGLIWSGLRDPKLDVRNAAVAALRACLILVEQRETRYRVQWWYNLFEQTMRGVVRPYLKTSERDLEASVHASLLTLGELLQHSGEFMLARYKQTVDTVLTFRDSKHTNVKQQVINLIPKMSEFAPEKFVLSYLEPCTDHLLSVLSSKTLPGGIAFQAFGQMIAPLAGPNSVKELQGRLLTRLPTIEHEVADALSFKNARDPAKRNTCMEAITCVGVMAEAFGTLWEAAVYRLLKSMILTGLSEPLTKALQKVARKLPATVPIIRQHILVPVLAALPVSVEEPEGAQHGAKGGAGATRHGPRDGHTNGGVVNLRGMPHTVTTFRVRHDLLSPNVVEFGKLVQQQVASQQEDEVKNRKLVKGALDTLRDLDLGPFMLLSFAQEALAQYGNSDDASIRKAAALAAWRVVERQWALLKQLTEEPLRAHGGAGKDRPRPLAPIHIFVERMIAQLLTMAACDVDPAVRRSTIECLSGTFDPARQFSLKSFFTHTDSVRTLSLCLNDSVPAVRLSALRIIGHVSRLNRAAAFPVLRRYLQQLLTDIENSPDSRRLEESSALLAEMICQAPALILPNLAVVQEKLVAKLVEARQRIAAREDGRSKTGHSMTDSVLSVLGVLAEKVSVALRPYIGDVLPLVVEAVSDHRTHAKHMPMAARCLGQIVGSTGCVIEPYTRFPALLPSLLRLLDHEFPAELHVEIVELLGIMGALGPQAHKRNQAALSGEGKLEADGVRGMPNEDPLAGKLLDVKADTVLEPLPTVGLMTHSDDFYPKVAIFALLKQLRDAKMAPHHQEVVSALMFIFKELQLGSVQYLASALPVLFAVVRVSEEALQQLVFRQLIDLVRIVQGHMRRYLPDFLELLAQFWDHRRPLLLKLQLQLLAWLARALHEDMRKHVGGLVPRFVALFQEAERAGNYSLMEPGLTALEALGLALEGYFHILLPSLVRLLPAVNTTVTPKEVKRSVLATMAKLLPRMRIAPHASAVLHPLIVTLRDTREPEVAADALNAICSVAVAIGDNMMLFVPSIASVLAQVQAQLGAAALPIERWNRLVYALQRGEAPCVSRDETASWDDASGWAAEMDRVTYNHRLGDPPENPPAPQHRVSQENLKKVWESSHRCTKEDWLEWMRRLGVELLAHSSSSALRSCHQLALVQPNMARELFSVGFVSCWLDIDEVHQQELVRNLEAALASPSIPPEIVTALLNLAEFMEHDERPLPLDTRTLGALAEKCHAFAKALHYKELEYQGSPLTAAESLIHICNQLRLPDAAQGILRHTMKVAPGAEQKIGANWYEKLRMYDTALSLYRKKLQTAARDSPAHWEATMGVMRCLASSADWEALLQNCRDEWNHVDSIKRQEMSALAAHAAWHMSDWKNLQKFVDSMNPSGREHATSTGALLRAVLAIQNGKLYDDFDVAAGHIARTRELLATELVALVGESYSRAYADIVRAQQCAELSEVVQYLRLQKVADGGRGDEGDADGMDTEEAARAEASAGAAERMRTIREVWHARLLGVERTVDVWTGLLAVRRLVLAPADDVDVYLKYATMCRKEGKEQQGWRTLTKLLGFDPMLVQRGAQGHQGAQPSNPQVMLSCLKHQWHTSSKMSAHHDIIARLEDLIADLHEEPAKAGLYSHLSMPPDAGRAVRGVSFAPTRSAPLSNEVTSFSNQLLRSSGHPASGRSSFRATAVTGAAATVTGLPSGKPKPTLIAKAYFCLAQWQQAVSSKHLDDEQVHVISSHYRAATAHAPHGWGKVWHKFGIFNMMALRTRLEARRGHDAAAIMPLVVNAMHAFFKSVSMSSSETRHETLQDVLRLLNLWFRYSGYEEVRGELEDGFRMVPIDTWLVVVPQMMARLHTGEKEIINPLIELLVKVGRTHPQALMYPLLVAARSASDNRRRNAEEVMAEIQSHSPELVEQTKRVSGELIRIAILWHEQWHEALEEASRLYFGELDVEGMLANLMPLHDKLNKAIENPDEGETQSEKYFKATFGVDLTDAYQWCRKYKESRRDADLQQAWDLYYHIFRRVNKYLPTVTTLDLRNVSHVLAHEKDLELAVPGTYHAGEPVVSIAHFASKLTVINSKQRPRKLTIYGSDGHEYQFLLKGHEDLRQDERVMQLFGLVNNLLAGDRNTVERSLSIARYAVIPLSPNSGLIGWVRNCDTLHALIREYRDSRNIALNIEHRIMQNLAPNYEMMMVIQKVEVFEDALEHTSGDDLHKVLWLKSRNSEVWLDRRTNYTRSTAVMSMAGYLLGLGDRHPSNLMLDRFSGKLVHIDFGDCFEASMTRDKFPERVPFRLTRMMVKAMEVSATEGNFSKACDLTMNVLREEKVSVMAMLEAFVFDPLINWRLLHPRTLAGTSTVAAPAADAAPAAIMSGETTPAQSEALGHLSEGNTSVDQLHQYVAMTKDASEALTEKAQDVMMRMLHKLEGRDFRFDGINSGPISPADQVQKLIQKATSNELLCQSYIGWCPFW